MDGLATKYRFSIKLYLIVGTFFLAALWGCSAKPPMLSKPIKRAWIIDAPIETLWKSTIKALVERGVQIDILDKESLLIVVVEIFDGGNFSQLTAERYNFCGGEARVNILFNEENETRSRIMINPMLIGQGRNYVRAKVASNGNLERNYYLLISGSLPGEKIYEWLEDVEPLNKEK